MDGKAPSHTHLVRKVPEGDAHAVPHRGARADDAGVVCGLLREAGGGRGEGREADVELGDGELEPERGELFEVLLQRGGDAADGEVRLQPDAVDGHALAFEGLDEGL